MGPEVTKKIDLKLEYVDFYNNLTQQKKGNKMQEKFMEILKYLENKELDINLIELLSNWNNNETMLKKFKNSSKIKLLDQFLEYCNEYNLFSDKLCQRGVKTTKEDVYSIF